jgi:hypothetical protein
VITARWILDLKKVLNIELFAKEKHNARYDGYRRVSVPAAVVFAVAELRLRCTPALHTKLDLHL